MCVCWSLQPQAFAVAEATVKNSKDMLSAEQKNQKALLKSISEVMHTCLLKIMSCVHMHSLCVWLFTKEGKGFSP